MKITKYVIPSLMFGFLATSPLLAMTSPATSSATSAPSTSSSSDSSTASISSSSSTSSSTTISVKEDKKEAAKIKETWIQGGKADRIEQAFKNGANPKTQFYGLGLLHYAALNKHCYCFPDVVYTLIMAGVDPNARVNGWQKRFCSNAITYVYYCDLLDEKSSESINNVTALHLAVSQRSSHYSRWFMIYALVLAGADVTIKDSLGCTPEDWIDIGTNKNDSFECMVDKQNHKLYQAVLAAANEDRESLKDKSCDEWIAAFTKHFDNNDWRCYLDFN